MWAWLRAHKALMAWLGIASLAFLVVGLLLAPVLVARMPADYFLHPGPHEGSWRDRHPLVRLLVRAGKNVLGLALILAGIGMLVLPGQGVLTILVGLALVEFPGKRRLELAIVRQPQVKRGIDWLRRRAGAPPLELPPRDDA